MHSYRERVINLRARAASAACSCAPPRRLQAQEVAQLAVNAQEACEAVKAQLEARTAELGAAEGVLAKAQVGAGRGAQLAEGRRGSPARSTFGQQPVFCDRSLCLHSE